MLARHQHRVLALPAEPRRGGERLLHHRRRVDEHLDVRAALGGEARGELLQLALEDVVVVLALRVDRDGAAGRVVERFERICLRRVAHAQHDDRAHLRPQRGGAAAPVGVRRHPAHVAVPAGGEEFRQPLAGRRRRVGRRHAHGVKAERARLAYDRVLERHRHDAAVRSRGWHSARTRVAPGTRSANSVRNARRDLRRAYQTLATANSSHGTSPR